MSEIVDVEEIYSEEYHRKAGRRGEKQYPAKQDMARAVHEIWQPESVIDVGCGRGWWMEYWVREHPEVQIVGLDGCAELIKKTGQCDESVAPLIHSCDFRRMGWPATWMEYRGAVWDLALSVEVGEHLKEQYAHRLVAGLCSLGDHIFFSAARPGQKGRHHVNLQPKEYWADLFAEFGFAWRRDLKTRWLGLLETGDQRYGRNIRRNAQFFTRETPQ